MSKWSEILKDLETRAHLAPRKVQLTRMRKALALLGISDRSIMRCIQGGLRHVIVVAGTNGKGSVAATLAHLLRAKGLRVGLFTSPHLVDVRERIQIGEGPASRELFGRLHQHVLRRTRGMNLGHFELLTLMAAELFFTGRFARPVQFAVFEVGMGGTWDPTNAIPHGTAVITKLGLDHQKFLGRDLATIAANKFGIVPKNGLVVHHPVQTELEPLKEQYRRAMRGEWSTTVPFRFAVKNLKNGPKFLIETPWGTSEINLPGKRGAENTALALTVFSELGFDPEEVMSALQSVQWPARMERVKLEGISRPIFLSGDHNAQGIESLIEVLKHYPRQKIHLVVGVAYDRDPKGILEPLLNLPQARVYLTEPPVRGTPVKSLRQWMKRVDGIFPDPLKALHCAVKNASRDDMIVVTGSLYLVGSFKSIERSQ